MWVSFKAAVVWIAVLALVCTGHACRAWEATYRPSNHSRSTVGGAGSCSDGQSALGESVKPGEWPGERRLPAPGRRCSNSPAAGYNLLALAISGRVGARVSRDSPLCRVGKPLANAPEPG